MSIHFYWHDVYNNQRRSDSIPRVSMDKMSLFFRTKTPMNVELRAFAAKWNPFR